MEEIHYEEYYGDDGFLFKVIHDGSELHEKWAADAWAKDWQKRYNASLGASYRKPTMTVKNDFSQFDESIKRIEDRFKSTRDKIEYARIEAEHARKMAEVLRVNHAYQTIKRRDEIAKAEREHLAHMDELEAEANEMKVRQLKVLAGISMVMIGVSQLMVGGL